MIALYNRSGWIVRGASAALLMSASTQLYGAGFSISDYLGSSSLGRSRAGGAAVAEDATTVFTNPAGLTRLSGTQWLVTALSFVPSAKFDNREGTNDALGQPISGGNGGDGGGFAPAAGLYYAKTLSEQWSFGFGINSPFGLATEYDRDWVGRYQTVKAALLTMNFNPSVGFKVNEALSIGAGFSLQYGKPELSGALDFGAVCLSSLDPATCAALGMPAPQSADGFLELDGDDWGWGFNLGVLWTLNASTRVGMAYRSKVKYTFEGDADFTTPAAATVFQPAFTDTQFDAQLTVPEHLSLSLYHQWTPRLAVMTDLTYTRWSRYKELRITFDNPNQPDNVIPKNWHNTWRVAIGLDYTYSPFWRFQAGLAFDESAMPAETFDPSVPAADQTSLSLGAQYQYYDTLFIGFGYTHLFYKDRDVRLTGAFGDTLRGEMDVHSNILSAQLEWRF